MNNENPWCFVLHIIPETDLDEAWQLLEDAGLKPLYMEEDTDKHAKIYIEAPLKRSQEDLLDAFPLIEYIEQKELGDTNWQAQWEAHGFNFHDGYVHVDVPNAVSPPWREIKLRPGAGFGDLSHPTTRLMMKMLKDYVADQFIVDVGCGSGILAIYAVAQGAKHAYAIDNDEQALTHTQENARLNGMEKQITTHSPGNFQLPVDVTGPIILMNMILSEQQEAWGSLMTLHNSHGICMASGILVEQKQTYLAWANAMGWTVQEEHLDQNWLGFIFKR